MYPKTLFALSAFIAALIALPAYAAPTIQWQTSANEAWQAPTLNDNTAAVVFLRAKQNLGDQSSVNLAINDRYLTSLGDGHYIAHSVCAGSVSVSAVPTYAKSNNLSAQAARVQLAPRQVQYLYVDVKPDFSVELRPVGEADAKRLIGEGKRQAHQISRVGNASCRTVA